LSVAEQITGVQQAAAAAGNADFTAQLLHTTQQGQRQLESKTWKISAGSREIVLRDQFDRLVKAITLCKDVGNTAGSIDPLTPDYRWLASVLMQVGLSIHLPATFSLFFDLVPAPRDFLQLLFIRGGMSTMDRAFCAR
jgi:hypothetical protein